MPELISLFLPGFIFICIFSKLFDKQLDISLIIIWSLFISYLFTIFYSVVHTFIYTTYNFNEELKSIIYISTGVALPFVVQWICTRKLFKEFLLKVFHQTVNKNIFDDIIDYNRKTMVKVFIKDTNSFYLGTFSLFGENRGNTFISLIDYALLDATTCKVIYKQNGASIIFNINDIDRIEFMYEEKSEVWKQLSKE